MWILSENQTHAFVLGKSAEHRIHHGVKPTQQMLPLKFAPLFTDNAVARMWAALAMQMANDVISRKFARKASQKCADIAAAIWDYANQHLAAIKICC